MAATLGSRGGRSGFQIKRAATKVIADDAGGKSFSQKALPLGGATFGRVFKNFGTRLARMWRAAARHRKLFEKKETHAQVQ